MNSDPSDRAHRPPIPPLLVIAFGLLATSTASIFIRFAQRDAPSLVIAAYRLTLASVFLAPAALTSGRAELRGLGRRRALLMLASGVFLALHFATWITSLEYTSVASSVVFVSTTPLWVGILSPLVLREKLSRRVVIGLALALLGGVVVGLSDTCAWQAGGLACPSLSQFVGGRAFAGDLLALAGAMFAAGYILIGRGLRGSLSLVGYIFPVYGFAALTLIILTAARGLPVTGFPPLTYLLFLALAVVPQLLGHSSYNWALKYVSAAFVSVSLLGEPVGSTLLAYFILREAPTLIKVAGAVLILAGIAVAAKTSSS